MFATELENALERSGRKGGADLEKALDDLQQRGLEKKSEVKLLAAALADYYPIGPRSKDELGSSVLDSVCRLLQDNDGVPADLVREQIVPHVLRLLDHHIELKDIEVDEVLFALKVLSLYGNSEVVDRIAKLAGDEWSADGFLWSVVFNIYRKKSHTHRADLLMKLSEPLPIGFAAVAYLDLANVMAREGALPSHPFDKEAGYERLRGWLKSTNEREDSYAVSTAAALPFVSSPFREQLLDLARGHKSPDVRLEAFWARAKLGIQDGIEELACAALDPNLSQRAVAYLEELGLDRHIPKEVSAPDFRAKAEMSAWLGHPMEFGRFPDRIELYDSREIMWPPTNDRRQVYLFRYEYEPRGDDEELDVGIGMVGSVTFALFGESTADKTPAEVYALHCAWELQQNGDPRAPKERTVASGMQILRTANPGMADLLLL